MKSEEKNIKPFVEKDDYVRNLIAEVTEVAIQKQKRTYWHMPFVRVAATITLVATIGGFGWMYMTNKKVEEAPLDTFLSSLSDEEASLLENYYIEDIYLDDWE